MLKNKLNKENSHRAKLFLEEHSSFDTKENLYAKTVLLPNINKTAKPFIFTLRKKNKSPIKTISYINNETGKRRHFTPAAQEWSNSIYSYNKNYIKLLPSADKNVTKLLKSYFNIKKIIRY